MKKLFTALLFVLCVNYALTAAQVDTLQVFSASMNKSIKTVVIKPDNSKSGPLATLYLLHGYSGDYSNWVTKVPYLKTLVDRYNYIVVCPDGGYDSWYWDTPNDSNYQYETFITKELISAVESKYNVCKDRTGRGISGLSMGGHGALYLAIQHQDIYGAAGSTSGGVDIRPFPNNWGIIKKLGEYGENKMKWDEHTVGGILHKLKPNALQLFIDCGYEDFFYPVNQKLHNELLYLNIPHYYLNLPGKHNWEYWSQSLPYQMAFFDQYFRN